MKTDDLIPIWPALADAKRREIIKLLQERPRTTGELCSFFDVSRFAVMKHLKVLEQAGLIQARREGRHRWYTLNDVFFQQIERRSLPKVLAAGEAAELAQAAGAWTLQLVEIEQAMTAPPAVVFQALTAGIDTWWQSGRQAGLSTMLLEPVVNGRFYEAFDTAGHGRLYGVVTNVQPPVTLWLDGWLGFVEDAAHSQARFRLASHEGGTRLQLVHRLIAPDDDARIGQYRQRWGELLGSLVRHVGEALPA